MITWELTINIILDTFNIDQKSLSKLLGVSESTLSRLKNGRLHTKLEPRSVFYNVFDPNNEQSPAKDTPEKLLKQLKDTIEYPQYQEVREDMDDLWNTADYEAFVVTLIQRTRCIPRPKVPPEPKTAAVKSKTQTEHIQESFLMTAQEFKVMEIINRRPPELGRTDSVTLGVFCDHIRGLVPYNSPPNSIERLIESFHDSLLRRTLVLNGKLSQFGFDSEAAFVNMEETDADSEEHIKKLKDLGVPELTDELLAEAENPLELLKITDTNWGKFRYEMNCIFEKIRSWSDETAEK